MKEKRPLHWTDGLTEAERSSDPSKVTSKSGPFPNTSSDLDPPLNLLPNRRHPETWPVEGSPLPSAATGATWGRCLRFGLGVQHPPRRISLERRTLRVCSRGLAATFGGSLSPLSGLGSGQPPSMLPLAPMVFWDLLSLCFPHVPEAYRVLGSSLLRPARPGLVPRGCDARLPRGPIAYRLPTGRHQPTLQTLCIPAGSSRASSTTLLSFGRRRPPCRQLRLRAPACARRCSTLCSWAPPPLGSLPTWPPAHSRGGPPGEPLP